MAGDRSITGSGVNVTRAGAWMADWACSMDIPEHHDPEVALRCGSPDIPLPPGTLSMLALAPEAVEALSGGRPLQRTWRGPRPVTVGEHLDVSVETGDGRSTAVFTGATGEPVATETFQVVTSPPPPPRGPMAFQTGPIDVTRLRALAWSLSQLRPSGPWPWADPPPEALDLAARVILPSLVAARAAGPTWDIARRITAIDVWAGGSSLCPGSTLLAEMVSCNPDRSEFSILADDRFVALATIHLEA